MNDKPEAWRLQTGMAAVLFALVVVGVSGWMYWRAWQRAIRDLDQRLLAGAAGVRYVLADDYHDRATAADAISVAEDDRNIGELSTLARRSGFKFLYTVIRKDGHIHLTSSSATKEELAANEEVRYFATYDEAQHLHAGVFDATNAVFVSYSDRWGEFRGAFLPEVSPQGHRYVAAAEVEVGFVRAMLRHHLTESAVIALVLLLASIPFFLTYIRKQKRHARALKEANERLMREMAERKAMEKELIRAHNMESLGKLAGGVAHDFNNILAAIFGHAELVLYHVGADSPAAQDIHEILRAGDRAKDLTRQILTFARKTGGEVKPVEVRAVAREVVGLIRSFIPSTIQFQERLESSASVMADAVNLHQIFMNLCTNAVHAMSDTGGRLSVAVEDVTLEAGPGSSRPSLPPGRYVRITVADTGAGISPELVDSIFEPYVTTKSPGEGTGLGLAVVHGIVASHGGDISVQSTPGSGTVFSVLLPALAVDAPPPPAVGRDGNLPRGTERILVVDDDPPVAHTTSRLLERLGYRVTRCTSSVEALATFRAAPGDFELILSDLTMPELTGDRLARAAVAIRPGMPVILCSGYSEKIRRLSECDGVTSVINKPFSGSELAEAVRAALDGTGRKPA